MRLKTWAVAAMLVTGAITATAKESASSKALVKVYERIADSILAAKSSEDAIVRAILENQRDQVMASLDANDLKAAAAQIGDFATEGGSAVEPIRSRLLAGGHHHHADDSGPEAVYDEGYVVLTKKMKQEALELAKRCAKAAEAPKPDAKETAAIREAFSSLASKALATK
jgi:hypothetical protein